MSKIELQSRASNLERRLRFLQRSVLGVSTIDKDKVKGDDVLLYEAKVRAAQEDWDKFQAVFDERFEVSELLKTADEDDKFPSESWATTYDKLRNEIVLARGNLLILQKRSEVRGHDSDVRESSAMNTTTFMSKPQLPRIPIPEFRGDLTKWTHFRDTFTSMVHNEPTLSGVEKLHYLISALKGEAASVLSRFPIEDSSYQQAWEKVVQTYDNPRVLSSILINRMVDCNVTHHKSELQRYEAFLTGVADSIDQFRALKIPNPCELLLATLALRALDNETRRQFELSLHSTKEFPTSDDVINFVRKRKTAIKMSSGLVDGSQIASKSSKSRFNSSSHISPSKTVSTYFSSSSSADSKSVKVCPKCKGDHYLFHCASFKTLPVDERVRLVRSWKTCFNCLRPGHRSSDCKSRFKCHTCKKMHHTLLHQDFNKSGREDRTLDTTIRQETRTVPQTENQSSSQPSVVAFGASPFSKARHFVMLPTARLLIGGAKRGFHPARALLDSCSQFTYITSSLAKAIGANITPFDDGIATIAEMPITKSLIKGTTSCTIRPLQDPLEFKTDAIVVDHQINSSFPNQRIPEFICEQLQDLPLADPDFSTPAPIDILIGADLYPQLVVGIPRHSGIQQLHLIPTVFGLTTIGPISHQTSNTSQLYFLESKSCIEKQLKEFWEIEEPSAAPVMDPDDVFCEEHFLRTHSRTPEGRYIVRFPFKDEFPMVGCNRDLALRRFRSLEKKFERDTTLARSYSTFMAEYQELGHMTPTDVKSPYLIPHHGVWQESQQERKLRVVFDASCTSSTASLNDLLLSGPKLQADLCSILIRFRLYEIPICADLVKMYRQILIHPDERHYQQIVWREDTMEQLREFQLNTVTYGVKSSAYHALRVIRQLVKDEGAKFPLAAKRITEDMYIDDIVSGANSIREAGQLVEELQQIFSSGGFSLSKWATTHQELIPITSRPAESVAIKSSENDSIKILGLSWNSQDDTFSYSARPICLTRITKRTMLSAIARIFDPLGLLAPIIFTAKSLIQELWKAKVGWDDDLPNEIIIKWKALSSQWDHISTVRIPRKISFMQARFTLIGFCDASLKGYAASLYLRSEAPCGDVRVALIKAKTKVAPLKFLSVPRLELCGALLLSKLVSSIPQSLSQTIVCFTDSQVVLAWLQAPVHTLSIFEANRVSQIQTVVPVHCWHHVGSEENPADVASRGCEPQALSKCSLWWNGPSWLKEPLSSWLPQDTPSVVLTNISEPKKNDDANCDWMSRFSSFSSLIRTVSRILRLARRARNGNSRSSDFITAKEYQEAEVRCIKAIQRHYLPNELLSKSGIPPKSYRELSPFVDDVGIVRVGGRLHYSQLKFTAKHPALIPQQSPLARLIILHTHTQYFHAGPTLTLALVRGKYWIPKAGKLIRDSIRRCARCRILMAKPHTPLMASLPRERISQFRCFVEVGVDYAGPFFIKESKRRNSALGKAYLCLFVCLASKALHLEVVSSLTTASFLAALERFTSRRGLPRTIFSDHGTNFVGASRILKDIYKLQRSMEPELVHHLAPLGVEWKFIPPRAPHFGGLWEAGVKSAKGLLARTMGSQPYTFEELSTAFCKIESLLNSRPLCPLKEDPLDFDFLTPGHLLTGCSSSATPPEILTRTSALSRWRLLQAQINTVWERWRKEYLHTLQQRNKWNKGVKNLSSGDLVIFLEKRCIPGHWPVGRVVDTFPGRDGVTRTVSVRTPTGSILTRAVTSLAPLFPSEESRENFID